MIASAEKLAELEERARHFLIQIQSYDFHTERVGPNAGIHEADLREMHRNDEPFSDLPQWWEDYDRAKDNAQPLMRDMAVYGAHLLLINGRQSESIFRLENEEPILSGRITRDYELKLNDYVFGPPTGPRTDKELLLGDSERSLYIPLGSVGRILNRAGGRVSFVSTAPELKIQIST